MERSLLFALSSMVLASLGDVLYKRAQLAGSRPTTFLWVQSVTFNTCNIAIALATGSLSPDPRLLLFGALLGATLYSSRLLFMRSLRTGDLSVNAPVFRLSFVVTAALAIGLSGEPATPGKLIGIGVSVFATVVLLDLRPGQAARWLRGSLPLIVATVGFGLFGWFQKLGTSAGLAPPALLVAQGMVYLALALPGSLLVGTVRPGRVELTHAPLCGVLFSTSFLALLVSLQAGEASVSIPIYQLGFVLTAVLAALLLGERLGARKIAGLVLATGAIAAFAAQL